MPKKKVHNPCEGCVHFYGYNAYVRCCNYLFDTGTPRPCPPGERCTVRRPGRHRRNAKKRC